MTSKPRSAEYLGISMEDTCLPSMRCPVQRRRDSHSGFRAEPGNLLEDEKGKRTSAETQGGKYQCFDESSGQVVEAKIYEQVRTVRRISFGMPSLVRKKRCPSFQSLVALNMC